MQPFDMGIDLYVANDASASGAVRNAPYQLSTWSIQPSYTKTMPFLVDVKTGSVWSRSLTPVISQGWNKEGLIKAFGRFKAPDPVRWVQCSRINTDGCNFLKYATIITDFIEPALTYSERRAILENTFPQLGIRIRPDTGELHLAPEFPEDMDQELWTALHLQNAEWNWDLYDGILMFQSHMKFFMQKNDPHQQTLRVMKYPFTS